jgi:hypothetical protein
MMAIHDENPSYREKLSEHLGAENLATDEEINPLAHELDAAHGAAEFGASNVLADPTAEEP